MNKCLVRFYGSVKEIIKFMVENMEFIEVNESGLKFVSVMNFGKFITESDELFMRDQYGVKPYEECCKMQVIVFPYEYKEYSDNEYYDPCDESFSEHVYNFKVENHGSFFDIYKTFEKNVCYQNKFVAKPREFMSEFFNYFAQPNISSMEDRQKLQKKMKQEASLEIEFKVYDFPLELLNKWYEQYELSVRAHWADKNEFLTYARFIDEKNNSMTENQYINKAIAEEDLQRYTQLLLVHKWADLHEMVIHIAEMLYDMKDNFPEPIELELKDVIEGQHTVHKFKYNHTYGSISNTVYSLANSEPFVLAKMYASLTDMHKKFMNKNN
jgi:hypothetical protein